DKDILPVTEGACVRALGKHLESLMGLGLKCRAAVGLGFHRLPKLPLILGQHRVDGFGIRRRPRLEFPLHVAPTVMRIARRNPLVDAANELTLLGGRGEPNLPEAGLVEMSDMSK